VALTAIIADYDARAAVERERVLRLASLLWRMRRATAVETDLFQIQAEILSDRRYEYETGDDTGQKPQSVAYRVPPGQSRNGLSAHSPISSTLLRSRIYIYKMLRARQSTCSMSVEALP
jgi:hypothetical protein